MTKLVVVESPAKVKTVGKYLGDEYTVTSSVGHIRDLPKSNKNAVDIENGFIPHYETVKGKEKVISEIKSLAKDADKVYLATDPDREGEAIAWHIAQAANLKNPKRITFNEITQDAVKEALAHPRDIDEHLLHAQEARRVLDRLFGYDLSALIWKKVRYGLSAGRVQSPALRIIMEREREIRAFKPETYWIITADLEKDALAFTTTCTEEPREEKQVEHILAEGRNGSWFVKDIKESEQKRAPRPPFITSTLQQTASTRLGFSPARTMGIAQKLYEAGHITYMRTDSPALSKDAQRQVDTFVEKEYGREYLSPRAFKSKSASAQEAHEAVRPTNISKRSVGNTAEQKKLYELIWQRAVASQMSDARLKKTKLITNIKEESIPDFAVNGSRVLFDGWLKADPAARGEETEVPKVNVGDALTLKDIISEQKETTPPPRYTEAGLVKELEKRGIGRPSTYASIIKTLVDRGYVEKEGRTLFPTDTGDVVSSFLEKYFDTYISDSFTAEMENELDDIAQGKRTYKETLSEFYEPFTKDIKAKEDIEKLTTLGDAPEGVLCPKCDSAMIVKLGRGGKFLSCDRFPECDGARTIDGAVIEPDKPIGTHPETDEDIYLLDGRFGPYVQLGEKTKKNTKPKRASIPKDKKVDEVTVDDAVKYLSLPRTLGAHPQTGEEIVASVGRFGPFIVHDGDFRSLKEDDVYTITLERALEILSEPKKTRRGRTAKKTATKKTAKKTSKKTSPKAAE